MLKTLKLVASSAALALMVTGASAATYSYSLSGTFLGGGTISGVFTFNDAGSTYSGVNIYTTDFSGDGGQTWTQTDYQGGNAFGLGLRKVGSPPCIYDECGLQLSFSPSSLPAASLPLGFNVYQWDAVFDEDELDRQGSGNLSLVPLPAALPLLGGAISLLGFFGWRRKRLAAA